MLVWGSCLVWAWRYTRGVGERRAGEGSDGIVGEGGEREDGIGSA